MPERAPLHVALLADDPERRSALQRALAGQRGLEVVWDGALAGFDPERLGARPADLILVDLPALSGGVDQCERLLRQAPCPVLFNEGPVRAEMDWHGIMARKLDALARVAGPGVTRSAGEGEGPATLARPLTPGHAEGSPRVWALGASLGGPDALTRFLGGLPAAVEAGFILAQHMGPGMLPLLVEQLGRDAALPVRAASPGERLRMGEVLVVPVDRSFRLTPAGEIQLAAEPAAGSLRPSIDDVFATVGECYGAGAGAIVFSGMGQDGLRGARVLRDHGGLVWAQDSASAAIGSMPDAVRRAGLVSRSGTPEELARQLVAELQPVTAGA